MNIYRIEQLEKCDLAMFGDLIVTARSPAIRGDFGPAVLPVSFQIGIRRSSADAITMRPSIFESEKRRATALVDELLMDIYYSMHNGTTDYNSTSGKSFRGALTEILNLQNKDICDLLSIISFLRNYIERIGSVLVRQLKRRDALRRQQEALSDVITRQLILRAPQNNSMNMRFAIQPLPGDTGFSQWVAAMKMVAQLPGGIPAEFRKRLWLTMADRHLAAKGVDWPEVERTCFSEWSHPADSELGVQIVKDLHRTGCSLFCGEDGQENQALLKRVLLAYARWNKVVGYCQGFNMLAALILQVTDKCEGDALKLMIYLIEGVLPDSYFADSLRGLSVDMAVFRELLRSRLPRLSKHLDLLQNAAKDGTRSYEPPLTNVFTMQWFLTLFCNCLPQPTVLRVWDLILLEGNEILLRTALAIWQVLAGRILSVRTADEFYCLMGVLTRELLEFDLLDANSLIKAVVAIGPLTELHTLREHYLYNINPWGSIPRAVDKQVKLYSKQSIALDIGALKKQYVKLKQRQRQAHIIFSAAITRQPTPSPPVTMNHLLLGKSALVPAKRLGPPAGSIPQPQPQKPPSTLHWKDTPKVSSSSSSSDTELCDEGSDNETVNDNNLNSQFDENNTEKVSERLSNEDNTTTDVILSETVEVVSNNLTTDSITNVKSESDDENFDFEQFLVDRVKCLRQYDEENAAEEKINFARRNSERALQIIQENSLILQRIMQCQSRLSPPSIETIDVDEDKNDLNPAEYSSAVELPHETFTFEPQETTNTDSALFEDSKENNISVDVFEFPSEETLVDLTPEQPIISVNVPSSVQSPKLEILEDYDFELSSSNSLGHKLSISRFGLKSEPTSPAPFKIELTSPTGSVEERTDALSPVYGSRYTNILEKSKSLDERYNALILGKQPYEMAKDTASDTLQTSYSWSLSPVPKSCIDPTPDSDSGIQTNRKFSDFKIEPENYTTTKSSFQSETKDIGVYESFGNDIGKVSEYKFETDCLENSQRWSSYPEYKTENLVGNVSSSSISSTDTYVEEDINSTPKDNPSTNSSFLASPEIVEGQSPKEYKLSTPDFENFYTFSKGLSLNDEIYSPTEIKEDHQVQDNLSSYSTVSSSVQRHILDSVSSASTGVSLGSCSSYVDNIFSDNLITISRIQEPNIDIEQENLTENSNDNESNFKSDYSSTFSASSKSCYPYLCTSSASDSIKLDLCRSEENENEDAAGRRKPLTLDLTSPPKCSISPLISPLKPLKSPSKSPKKSPNKGFNPFPVSNSARQNKEVLLKLGLYKK